MIATRWGLFDNYLLSMASFISNIGTTLDDLKKVYDEDFDDSTLFFLDAMHRKRHIAVIDEHVSANVTGLSKAYWETCKHIDKEWRYERDLFVHGMFTNFPGDGWEVSSPRSGWGLPASLFAQAVDRSHYAARTILALSKAVLTRTEPSALEKRPEDPRKLSEIVAEAGSLGWVNP